MCHINASCCHVAVPLKELVHTVLVAMISRGTVFDAVCSACTVLKYGAYIKISQTLYFSKMREQPGSPQMLQDMPS